jgi:hypothetical protein
VEWLNALGAFLAGLLLRYGIPFALTGLLAWLLRQLDARWQAEAERERRRLSAVGADMRQVRCWETLHCPPERRETCPAYAHPETPCWQVFRDRDGRLREACLSCDVFLEAPVLLGA